MKLKSGGTILKVIFNLSNIFYTYLLLNLFICCAYSQQLTLNLPDTEGAPGQDVTVDISLSGNTEAAQAGIFIVFNPDVVTVIDAFQVRAGKELDESKFFITPAVKNLCLQAGVFIPDCAATLGSANTMGLSSGIFPKDFPPDLISNGTILRIIFTVNPEAEIGNMTGLEISTQSFFATSFSTTTGNTIAPENLNLINGSITVVEGSSGSGCSVASINKNGSYMHSAINILFLLLPIIFIFLRKRLSKHEDRKYA